VADAVVDAGEWLADDDDVAVRPEAPDEQLARAAAHMTAAASRDARAAHLVLTASIVPRRQGARIPSVRGLKGPWTH